MRDSRTAERFADRLDSTLRELLAPGDYATLLKIHESWDRDTFAELGAGCSLENVVRALLHRVILQEATDLGFPALRRFGVNT